MTSKTSHAEFVRKNEARRATRSARALKGAETRRRNQQATASSPNPDYVEPAVSAALSASILTEAAGIVEGSRQTTHGDKERSFQAIADSWNTFLKRVRLNPFDPISASDVAMMMVLMKMARAEQGTFIRDHAVDMAGYAAIAGEISLGEPTS